MALDALWIVSFKCIVKGYQECRFDVKDGEVFRVLKKIGEKGRAFRIANERGQLGQFRNTPTGIMIAFFYSVLHVLLTAVNSL